MIPSFTESMELSYNGSAGPLSRWSEDAEYRWNVPRAHKLFDAVHPENSPKMRQKVCEGVFLQCSGQFNMGGNAVSRFLRF